MLWFLLLPCPNWTFFSLFPIGFVFFFFDFDIVFSTSSCFHPDYFFCGVLGFCGDLYSVPHVSDTWYVLRQSVWTTGSRTSCYTKYLVRVYTKKLVCIYLCTHTKNNNYFGLMCMCWQVMLWAGRKRYRTYRSRFSIYSRWKESREITTTSISGKSPIYTYIYIKSRSRYWISGKTGTAAQHTSGKTELLRIDDCSALLWCWFSEFSNARIFEFQLSSQVRSIDPLQP